MFDSYVSPWDPEDFLNICEMQDGVFSRQQALDSGLSPSGIQWRLMTGRWDRMLPGVYRIHGGALEAIHHLRGALLWAGPGSLASHLSAAYLWKIVEEFPPIEITAPTKRKPISGITVHHRKLEDQESGEIDGIAVTNPARTVLDIASRDRWLAEVALDSFLRNKQITFEEMTLFIKDHCRRGVPGTKAVKEMLALRGPAELVESALERKLLAAIRRWGLPEPATQVELVVQGNRYRLDFAYPELNIGIEADGYKYHSGRERFDRDTARRNQLALAGWLVVHVTWARLHESPGSVRQEIESALRTRGTFRH